MIDRDELPADPDLDYADSDLRLLHGLNHGVVVVIDADGGVSYDGLCLVPSMFRRAALGPEESIED